MTLFGERLLLRPIQMLKFLGQNNIYFFWYCGHVPAVCATCYGMNGYNYVHSKEDRLLSFLWMQQFWPCLDFCSVWVSRVCGEMFHFNGRPYCSYISLVSWCIGITFYWSQLVKSKTKSWLIILALSTLFVSMLVVLHLYLRWLLVYVTSTWMLWVGFIDELFFSASKCKKKLPSALVTM